MPIGDSRKACGDVLTNQQSTIVNPSIFTLQSAIANGLASKFEVPDDFRDPQP